MRVIRPEAAPSVVLRVATYRLSNPSIKFIPPAGGGCKRGRLPDRLVLPWVHPSGRPVSRGSRNYRSDAPRNRSFSSHPQTDCTSTSPPPAYIGHTCRRKLDHVAW